MGFFHQLRLLLWKNWTLKKRSPLVVMMEMFIPLVLFVILLLIRKKLPASKMPVAQYHARALPSTGLLSLIQIFCEGEGELDQHGFLNFSKENQLGRLLGQLQVVAEDHDFFRPGMSPREMDDLPQMYQAVIDDPAFMIDSLHNATDVPLTSVLDDEVRFKRFLRNNLSLPDDEVDALINSTLHVKQIYHYIFGGHLTKDAPDYVQTIADSTGGRFARSVGANLDPPPPESSLQNPDLDAQKTNLTSSSSSSDSPDSSDSSSRREEEESTQSSSSSPPPPPPPASFLDSSFMLKSLSNTYLPKLMQHLASVSETSHLSSLLQNILLSSPDAQAQIMKVMSEQIFKNFGSLDFDKVLGQTLQMLQDPKGFSSTAGFDLLMKILDMIKAYKGSIVIKPEHIAQALKLLLRSDRLLEELLCDNSTFHHVIVPSTDFSNTTTTNLQQDLCHLNHSQLTALSQELITQISDDRLVKMLKLRAVNLTATAYKLSSFLEKAEHFMKFQRELEEIAQLISLLPYSENMTYFLNDTVTTPGPGNTSVPIDTGGDEDPGDSGKKKNSWKKMWDFLHKTVCGKKTPVTTSKPPATSTGRTVEEPAQPADGDSGGDDDDDILGMTKAQQDKLSIITHYLYHNPTVLYAPNGSAAGQIIQKANATVAFIDLISDYAREWLNISEQLHVYLHQDKTERNLQLMKKMQADIRDNESLLSWLFGLYNLSPFLEMDIHSSSHYDHQLRLVDAAAHAWLSMMRGINLNIFRGFASEDDMLTYFLTQAYHDNASIIAGVVFEDLPPDGSIPPHVRYKIRQNATYLPSTKQVRKPTWVPGPGRTFYPYYQFGFVWVQDMIERAVIDLQVGRDVVEPGSYIQQFPYPCYVWDQFMFMIEHVMPLCLTFSWVYSVAMLVQSIVYEKEQRLKEVMKMMGMSNAVHWCAWFVTTFLQMTISVLILTILLKMGNVLPQSNVFIIFLVLQIYICAIISFCFLISVLYSKAKVAAACAGIIYFLSYVPYMYIAIKEDIAGDNISGVWKTLASLFSTTAFGLGAKYFAFYEEMGVGVQWDNLSISPTEHDEFNLFLVTLMMVVDCIVYGLLVWYIEHVHPGSYGLPKPWYFPFMKSYWCGGGGQVEHCTMGNPFLSCSCCRTGIELLIEEDQACAMGHQHRADYAQRFEPDPAHLPLGVCIDNLTKVYKLGKKTAVKNLSLNLYEGQITSFLGHNGAGKTTTMSMLTGLIPPTAGTASVYNYDIRTDMDVIRQSLGMCPQHNVLFDQFTVEEHLWFYAKLKGMKPEDIQVETDKMIDDLGLPDKRNTRVDCLSGGMQRKLSVAIAFVGGSRTVILDEPTAGVDPYARRAIWDLLVKFKKGRTILLSTHHMDEADFLGDRIAIISNGELKCCGSSVFLKNVVGEGYHLTLSKVEPPHSGKEEEDEDDGEDNPTDDEEDEDLLDIGSDDDDGDGAKAKGDQRSKVKGQPQTAVVCQESRVTKFVTKYVSSGYLVSESTRELHYVLPFEEAKKGGFEKLFTNLDNSLSELGISSYGVMDTNLEEIFLKVTEAAYIEEDGLEDSKPLESFSPEHAHSHSDDPPAYPAVPPMAAGHQHQHAARTSSPTLFGASGGVAENRGAAGVGGDDDDDQWECDSDDVPLLSGGQGGVVLEDFSVDPSRVPGGRPRSRSASMVNMASVGGGATLRSAETPRILLEGRGSHMMGPKLLLANHFKAVIIKRFHYITRNWRSLFSQIILPAIFVAIAMTVALAAPSVDDLPPLELSSTQYTNITLPRGNYVPFTNERMSHRSVVNPDDADAVRLQSTLSLPSGLGSSCVVRNPDVWHVNSSADYNPGCQWLFSPGLHYPLDHRERYGLNDFNMSLNPLDPSYSCKKYYPHGCACKSDGTGFICRQQSYEQPPGFRVVTLDLMENVTGQKTSDYLLFTTYDKEMHRYGALSFGLVQHFVPENFGHNAPTMFKKLAVRNVATMWFNHKGYHSMGVFLNALNNAILRANMPASKGNPAAYGITLYNHPWNDTNSQLSSLDYILEGSDVLISIFIIAAMSFVPASFVVFLVYEKSTKAKHLQFVTGMNPVMYWIGNYTWDMANYVIPAFMCVMILLIFQIPAYVSAGNLPAVVALFLMYGWSMTPVMYPASFWFKEPSTAYIALIVINLFTGITCIVCSFLLEIFSYDHDLERVHKVLKVVFMMFPNYCLGRGLMELAFNEYQNEYYFKTGQMDKMKSAMEWDLIPCHLVAMACVGLLFFCLTLMCEYRFFIRPRQSRVSQTPQVGEDNDVAIERRRVTRGNGKYDTLVLDNLTKVYKTRKLGRHLAVDRLCLGVPPGECFGLLGVNGAGKTTTFKMLTGDLEPSSGSAYLNGYSVVRDIKKVQQSVGYCPQFDSLYDELTPREHLQLYCRLRGIPPSDENQVVEWALTKLGLSKFADKLSGTLSGGNKRKLSTAIALIGHPPVIFMDEPTTGMDPHSRRFLWDLILSLVQDGRSVILTSHSMEECEALCSRMAIMVNGTFKCLGSATHLKNRYGDGYTFTIRVRGPNYQQAATEVLRFVNRNIPQATLKEQHYNIVQYELKSRPVSVAQLFSKLEEAERNLSIEDYSVSQNTLDNVFINFVKQQTEIVQDESEEDPRSRSLSSRLRMRATSVLRQSDEPMLIPRNNSDDSLNLSDDDIMLRLDDNDGTRLTLMPM
ncbi:ATP-binding cassette sub-family A member 2 [Aplysia californica]|uniref:ATP-binding cassette sub-family A member 2 n=1 Tax=Aplysia californica TaxID=6500 RepID=A0ABM0ZVK1_APLCA|nr:ATP-binding cassette sub-family A member 2 [Aplysia californica]